MHTVVELVTPELARRFLEGNAVNRKLRQSWISQLVNVIKRGEWKVTHQGLAISPVGRLLDGQHRLNAIIKADKPVHMMVTYDVPESVYDVLDSGARRKTSDALGLPTGVVAAASELARMVYHDPQATPQFLRNHLGAFLDLAQEALEFAPSLRKGISNGPVRAALIVRMAQMPEAKGYQLLLYRNLVLANLGDLPPVGLSFFRQSVSYKHTSTDWFCLALKAFDPANKDLTRTFVKDSRALLEETRSFVKSYALGSTQLKAA